MSAARIARWTPERVIPSAFASCVVVSQSPSGSSVFRAIAGHRTGDAKNINVRIVETC